MIYLLNSEHKQIVGSAAERCGPRGIVAKLERLMSVSTITVNGSNPATVTTGGKMTVAVANGPGNPTDWVAIYSASVPDNTPNGWVGNDDLYLNGSETTAPTTGLKSATLTFPVPSTPGAYQARFYANDGYTVITRAGITVNAS